MIVKKGPVLGLGAGNSRSDCRWLLSGWAAGLRGIDVDKLLLKKHEDEQVDRSSSTSRTWRWSDALLGKVLEGSHVVLCDAVSGTRAWACNGGVFRGYTCDTEVAEKAGLVRWCSRK